VESSGGGSEFHRRQEATLFYVGLDIHDKRIAICVLGQIGQIVRRAQVRTVNEVMRMLEALPDGFGTQVTSRGPTWRIATPRYSMGATANSRMVRRRGGRRRMDVWEIPRSSRSGPDSGFLMDVGPMRVARPTGKAFHKPAAARQTLESTRDRRY
jgi:hypothetical protein